MKSSLLALLLPAVASARFIEASEGNQVIPYPDDLLAEKFLVELAPGETRWVTEDEKWELRRVSHAFLRDSRHIITSFPSLTTAGASRMASSSWT